MRVKDLGLASRGQVLGLRRQKNRFETQKEIDPDAKRNRSSSPFRIHCGLAHSKRAFDGGGRQGDMFLGDPSLGKRGRVLGLFGQGASCLGPFRRPKTLLRKHACRLVIIQCFLTEG